MNKLSSGALQDVKTAIRDARRGTHDITDPLRASGLHRNAGDHYRSAGRKLRELGYENLRNYQYLLAGQHYALSADLELLSHPTNTNAIQNSARTRQRSASAYFQAGDIKEARIQTQLAKGLISVLKEQTKVVSGQLSLGLPDISLDMFISPGAEAMARLAYLQVRYNVHSTLQHDMDISPGSQAMADVANVERQLRERGISSPYS